MKVTSYASAFSGDYDSYRSLAEGSQEGAKLRKESMFGGGLSYSLFFFHLGLLFESTPGVNTSETHINS